MSDAGAAAGPVPDDVSTDDALVYRHRLSTRVWHWLNAVTVFVMLMSGLMIFNAHPRLYWGEYGANHDPAWLEIGSTRDEGYLRIGTLQVTTTGVLGRSADSSGQSTGRAFPAWATIPSFYSLADARRWHLTFAWILALGIFAFWTAGLANRHVQKDLAPSRAELSPGHLWRDIADHVRLRFPSGAAALRYTVLQKLAYLAVVLGIIPLLVLTGLAMSPGMNAAWPWLLDLFGGRQSARSLHFILMVLMLLFILVHLIEVLLAGPFNEIRSMITGRFRIRAARTEDRR